MVVLIHGLGLCRHLWSPYVPVLARQFRVVNYDLYGHGNSAPINDKASLALYASQLAHLMDHLDIPNATIIGFSIGGMINRRFAMDYPERANALAILNSPHDRGEKAQLLVEERAAKVREQGALATLDDALKRWFTQQYLEVGDGVEKVRQWRGQVDAESYAETAWVLANGVRELISPAIKISEPSLVMTCENDTGSTPEMSHRIASEIEGSDTVIIPELKHLGLMEKPELFTEPLLSFLERVAK